MAADIEGLPGAERVARGLRDLAARRPSVEALLLAAAATRLRDLGLPIPERGRLPREPELALYKALEELTDDPYYRYNALRRELDSFMAALETKRARPDAAPGVAPARTAK